jgi:hypothetical protein
MRARILPVAELERLEADVRVKSFAILGRPDGKLFMAGYVCALSDIRDNAPEVELEPSEEET